MKVNLILLRVLVVGAFILVTCAFYVPKLIYRDRDGGLTPLQATKLKNEAAGWAKIPAVVLQITEATPEGADYYDYPNGVVVWRSVFGIEYGRTETYRGQSHTDFQDRRFNIAWALFIGSPFALVGVASLLLVVRWRHRS